MRRPLFAVCLCLVTIVALRLWLNALFDTGEVQNAALASIDGEHITVTGRVHRKDTQSFELSDVAVLRQNIPINKNIICECGKEQTDDAGDLPAIGSIVTVRGSFRTFDGATNPGEFDAAKYYDAQGIMGKLTGVDVLEEGDDYSLWRETMYQLKYYFMQRLHTVFPQKEASVMTAMLLGDKVYLDKEIKDLYKENGIIHILSISGLHISIIGMSIYQMLRKAGVPVWLAAFVGGSILCLYGVMTGLSVSACRAIGMYLIRVLADAVGRTYDMLTALGVLAVCMVWHNPLHLQNAGFLLSFGSVAGIGWYYPALVSEGGKKLPKLCQSVLASASITLFTLPIQLWFYYEIPAYSILINLLILPFMSVVLMTGLVVMILPGSGVLGTVTCLILQGYEWLCRCFEQLPCHTWNPGRPEARQVILYYLLLLGAVWLRRYGGTRDKRFSVRFLLLPVAVFILTLRMGNGNVVTFLDVGQGDCIVVETSAGEVFLFDCGSTDRKQVGEYVLLPFLKYNGIRHIDAVFLSHPDADHCSGIRELFAFAEEEGITIGQLVLPDVAEEIRKAEWESLFPRIVYMSAGDRFATESASFQCLHPPADYDNEDTNAYSECFYIELGSFSLLLTGDVEGEGEELLIQEIKRRNIKRVTALKVAHHGSGYSTTQELLQEISPRVAVVSCGKNNSYGHPHPETLERLADAGSLVLTTPECGAITIEIGRRIAVRSWLPHRMN